MISATKIFSISIFMLILAWVGAVLHFLYIPLGSYIIYFSVSVGGLAIFIGSVANMLGKLDNDLKKGKKR